MDTYSHISSSLSPSEPESGLLIKKKRKAPKTAYKSGAEWTGNRSGKRKGTVSIKAAVDRCLTRAGADKIAEVIISGSEAGEDKKIDVLLKLKGELQSVPSVSVTNNTMVITPELIASARQYLLERTKNSAGEIIDVQSAESGSKVN